jgi:hypothetical protein
MTTTLRLALFLIAACAAFPSMSGPIVYRCGNTYSQIPCPNARMVDTDDGRSRAQKLEARRAAEREKAATKTIEEARKKEEEQALETTSRPATLGTTLQLGRKPKKDAASGDSTSVESTLTEGETLEAPASTTKKKKLPPYFTAKTPAAPQP